jgi:Na+/pantothenate symporter
MMINEIYAEIMRDIDNKILHWGILKYIASHLYLNIKDKKKKNKKVKKIKDKNN